MANKVRKTEHSGAKNGGGHWGSRAEAKAGSKSRRRQDARQIIIAETKQYDDSGLTAPIREEIEKRLSQVEVEHGVKIIHAIESGSRVWGFHSPDSDYDVRFIYVRPMAWYLSIRDRRDVIEPPIEDSFDLSGWDLQKALNLMSKSNPPLFEWLSAPLVYRTTPLAEQMQKVGKSYFNPRAAIYHYLHMADGNYRTYLRGDVVRLKKYLYVLRPLLCCRWIEQNHSMPPPVMRKLIEAQANEIPLEEIEQLLVAKAAGLELSDGPRILVLNEFIERQLGHFSKSARVTANMKTSVDDLDELFFNAVKVFL